MSRSSAVYRYQIVTIALAYPLQELIILNPQNKAQQVFCDLLVQLTQYEPERRPTAKQALQHDFFTLTNIEEDAKLEDVNPESEKREV